MLLLQLFIADFFLKKKRGIIQCETAHAGIVDPYLIFTPEIKKDGRRRKKDLCWNQMVWEWEKFQSL